MTDFNALRELSDVLLVEELLAELRAVGYSNPRLECSGSNCFVVVDEDLRDSFGWPLHWKTAGESPLALGVGNSCDYQIRFPRSIGVETVRRKGSTGVVVHYGP